MTGSKGELEFLSGTAGRCRVWKNGAGYISNKGGFTNKMRDAAVFNGPGLAIARAQALGFAIVRW